MSDMDVFMDAMDIFMDVDTSIDGWEIYELIGTLSKFFKGAKYFLQMLLCITGGTGFLHFLLHLT